MHLCFSMNTKHVPPPPPPTPPPPPAPPPPPPPPPPRARGTSLHPSNWLLVVSVFQASLVGNLRFILTASAPICPTVLSFLRATLGCLVSVTPCVRECLRA